MTDSTESGTAAACGTNRPVIMPWDVAVQIEQALDAAEQIRKQLIESRAELAAIKAAAEDSTEYVLAQVNRELRAENERLKERLSYRDRATTHSEDCWKWHPGCAERKVADLQQQLDRYRILCPSMIDLETDESLHPESTITVGLGYLHTLLEAKDRLDRQSSINSSQGV